MEPVGRRPAGTRSTEPTSSVAELATALRCDVEALTRSPERAPGSAGHAAAREHLALRGADLGLRPYLGASLTPPAVAGAHNVLALVPGRDRHRRLIVLATTYDTARGDRGASRNAAAAAVLLAVAPRLLRSRLERGVLLAFLDQGRPARSTGVDALEGASVLLQRQCQHDVKAAIVLDRLGHPGDGDVPPGMLLVTGAETDARLPSVVAGVEVDGLRLAPVHRRYRQGAFLSAAFQANLLPYLELCGGRWSRHDGPDDAVEALDLERLARVVDVLEALVVRLDTVRLPGPFEGFDSSAFEAERLERALGPLEAGAANDQGGAGAGRALVDRAVARLLPLLDG